MYLLYLDDSGSTKNADDKHIVLAGLAVNQFQPYWLSRKLSAILDEVFPHGGTDVEFRGSAISSGRTVWRRISREVREDVLRKALHIVANDANIRLFGAVVHKISVAPHDAMEVAFEQVCSRFDHFLRRLHNAGKTERGILILDKSSYETSLQTLATEFNSTGHTWGTLKNIAEVPLFVDSKATRLVQLADLVAYALRKYYHDGQGAYFDIISGKFDKDGGVLHGLVHRVSRDHGCVCFACRSR